MRPIATTIIRDTEIQRIKDNITRVSLIESLLNKHKEFLRRERYLFIKTKNFSFLKERKKKSEINKNESKNNRKSIIQNDIIESISEKSLTTKNDQKKEEKVNVLHHFKDLGSALNEYNVENEFTDIIRKYYIETDHDIELEMKKHEDELNEIEFFLEKVSSCPEDKLIKIFNTFEERQNKFVDIISKTLIEMISFLKIFTKLFDLLIKYSHPIETFKNTVYHICSGILNKDALKCENIFLNYGIGFLLDNIKVSPVYRSEMCKIIFALISNNHFSHLEVLNSVRKKFATTDETLYYHILVHCMSYLNEENLDLTIFEFYETAIIRGLNSSCDVIKCKAMYMVTISMIHDQMNSLSHADSIFKHSKSWNWEVLSLILIYCSRILLYYNSSKEEKIRIKNSGEAIDETNKNELSELEERLNEMAKYEEKFLSIIDSIFERRSPNNTLKIGFIYLANILHYYPNLAEKYIKLIIELDYIIIRQQVLEIDNASLEMEYTGNSLAEKYKICGAPLLWMPIYIAGIFRDYILKNNIQALNETHLEIFHSIVINQDFNDEDSDLWIDFFSDMKPYIFVSLSTKDFANVALNICQKIFTFEKILPTLLSSTFDTFISTMKYIYDYSMQDYENENDVSPENMKILLTFISEIKIHECQSYIYRLIKSFAIQNNEIYLKSNLLELMNRISQEQRGDIFD